MFDPLHEIFCLTENTSVNTIFYLDPVGTIWDVEFLSSSNKVFSIDIDGSSDGGEFIAIPNPPFPQGFNHIATSENADYNQEDFGFGLYRLSALGKFFYIDFRDSRYLSYSNCDGHCADIYVKYDYLSENLYIRNGPQSDFNEWVLINSGEYLTIWNLKNQGNPNTELVPNYWQNCLVCIPEEESDSISTYYVAHLVWGPKPNFNASGYKVFRVIS